MLDAQALADRYVAAWNEPDADGALLRHRRRFGRPTRSAKRERADTRIRARKLTLVAPEKNAGRDGVRYRAAPSARLRGDVVTFRWEMVLAGSETVLASGLEFLIVDDEGRILVDHPFVPA